MSRRTAVHVAVLGDGGWGTTLAIHLFALGHRVRWWGAFADHVQVLDRCRENGQYLPGILIPPKLPITADLSHASEDAEVVVLATPSKYLRSVARQLRGRLARGAVVISVAKGLEPDTLRRMSEVVTEELPRVTFAALSGPNIAAEIARGQPASTVIACRRPAVAARLQRMFLSPALRVYTSADVAGVELGGALKNPIAIAAGIGDGLGFGANAKAALVTRGVVEMARLGVALGAKRDTFWGLSGLGDLLTTCLGGRNRALGEAIGQGQRPAEVVAGTSMVYEGVLTSKAAVALARRHRVEVPIIEQVAAVLFRGTSPASALRALMGRPPKAEA
jgi:glycerol-3-phosphate dehydrogenase (NAD(P)+)